MLSALDCLLAFSESRSDTVSESIGSSSQPPPEQPGSSSEHSKLNILKIVHLFFRRSALFFYSFCMKAMITVRVLPMLLVWRRFGDVRWRVMTRTGWQHLVRLADELSHSLKMFKHFLIRIYQPVFNYYREKSHFTIPDQSWEDRAASETYWAIPLWLSLSASCSPSHLQNHSCRSHTPAFWGVSAWTNGSGTGRPGNRFFMKTSIFAYYFLVNTFRSNEN